MKTNLHLIIGDAHCKPESNMRRFIALGNFIEELARKNKYANIKTIDMGDFEDMQSLSSYDKGKASFEGRRVADDFEAALRAREYVYTPQLVFTGGQKKGKRAHAKVEHYALGGNHCEGRINRYCQDNPELLGTLSVPLSQYEQFGIKYVPYRTPINIDGIEYCHYWQQRGTGRAMGGGKYPAASILREKHCSSVVGHAHILDRATTVTGNGNKLFSLVAGCFLDPDEHEEYAGQGNDAWWKGIVVLRDVVNGFPEGGEEYITVERLLKEYL